MITIVVSPRRKDLMRFPKMSRFFVLLAVLLTSACGHQDQAKPDIGECNNSELTDFDDLLIVAPHPDDEILGFAGLASAFVRQGKSVRCSPCFTPWANYLSSRLPNTWAIFQSLGETRLPSVLRFGLRHSKNSDFEFS